MAERFIIRCSQCEVRGKIWLSGNDYLECPQCQGAGSIEIHQHKMQARVRKVFVPGMPAFEVVDLPRRSLVTDNPIKGR